LTLKHVSLRLGRTRHAILSSAQPRGDHCAAQSLAPRKPWSPARRVSRALDGSGDFNPSDGNTSRLNFAVPTQSLVHAQWFLNR